MIVCLSLKLMCEANEQWSLAHTLLDSNLIRQTNKMQYNAKIYKCGDYSQLYLYESTKIKKDTNLAKTDKEIMKKKIIFETNSNSSNKPKFKEIRSDNVMRSKLQIQRIIKANIDEFKTFITLTFEDNIDINTANKKFNSWRTHTKKIYYNFKYISIPEFQKRGAVHYHLLTNIDYNNDILVNQEVKEIWNPQNKVWHVFKTLKYWNNGYSSIKDLTVDKENMNVIGYMSKYVTKDIDNRLYGRKKYFYSKSLNVPEAFFFDTKDKKIYKYIDKLLKNKKITYQNVYLNKFTKNKILFFEFYF